MTPNMTFRHGVLLHTENLQRLAEYLDELETKLQNAPTFELEPEEVRFPPHGFIPRFTMQYYTSYHSDRVENCGTAGCAVGHAPYCGIEKQHDESWMDYSHRTLIAGVHQASDHLMRTQGRAWDYCFHGSWAHIDNSPSAAAARIRELLENGVPEPHELDDYQRDYIARRMRSFTPPEPEGNNECH